jgi:hypothetical protein
MDDEFYTTGRCTNCGNWCQANYEHCDKCLMAAVRGINAVDRAVKSAKDPFYPTKHDPRR